MRRSVRSTLAQLTVGPAAARALALAASLLVAPCAALAQSAPAPHPSATLVAPKVPLHAEIFVDTNKLGQVSHIVSIKPSPDKPFNTQVYGNATQAFIRTADGGAIPGLYRLSYDYNPATRKVSRSVVLVKAGGVDPEAPGMVTVIQKSLDESRTQTAAPSKLPDFDKIVQPTAQPH